MINLYLALAGFALIVIAYLMFPIIKMNKAKLAEISTLSDHEQSIFTQKHQELKTDLADDKITQQDFDEAFAELKQELAIAIERTTQSNSSANNDLKLILLLPVAIILASAVYYYTQSKQDELADWYYAKENTSELGQKIIMGKGDNITQQDLQHFYLALRTKLINKPDDAVGWMLLGRTAASIHDMEASIKAFEMSLALDPNNQSTLISYVHVLASSRQENNLHKAANILRRLLQVNPQDADSLVLLGYVMQQLGDSKTAVDLLAKALTLLPENDQRAITIRESFPALAGEVEPPAATGAPQVIVDLTKLPAQTQFKTLFVFARPAKSGPPFAVQKIDLTNGIPASVTLTDANAMIANMNLSAMTQGYVTARFSFDENVMLADGEIEYHSAQINIEQSQATQVVLQAN